MLLSESLASIEDDDDDRLLVEPLGREEENRDRESAKAAIKDLLKKY